MKKILTIFLGVLLTFSLIACVDEPTDSDTGPTKSEPTKTTVDSTEVEPTPTVIPTPEPSEPIIIDLPDEVLENMAYELTLGTILNQHTERVNHVIYEKLEVVDIVRRPQKVFNAKIDPSDHKVEMVLHDMMHLGYQTVKDIALDYEARTGKKVIAAVNGDFFWAEQPIDHYLKDGNILHKGLGNAQSINFGFNNEGEYVIGKIPSLTDYKLRIFTNDGPVEFTVQRINGLPHNNELAIGRPGATLLTKNTSKYLVQADRDTINRQFANFPYRGTVIRDANQELYVDEQIVIPQQHFGIAFSSTDREHKILLQLYELLQNNVKVEVFEAPTGIFRNMRWGVGGKNVLVNNSIVMPEPFKDGSSGNALAPRTTIGVNADGSFFIQVIDGRQATYSAGITTFQQAQLAFDMGAVAAVELDGGGSSTFILRIDGELVVMNRPSDGNERKVINAVLIVEK